MKDNSSKSIAMVLANPFKPDLRVYKEAKSLVKAGYDVTIIAWDREGQYYAEEIIDGINVKRIGINAPYGTGIFKFNKIFLFLVHSIRIIKKCKFSIIHCHDFDTLMTGVFFKLLYDKRLVYDSHENYSKMIRLSSSCAISFLVEKLEKTMLHFVDLIIIASSTYGAELSKNIKKPITVIGNWQNTFQTDGKLVGSIRDNYRGGYKLLITYIGTLDKSRSIIPMIKAVEAFPKVRFLICGDGTQRGAIERMLLSVKNATYIGAIPQYAVPHYTAASDIIYYVMDYRSAMAKYNAPNSLGFALIAGRAVIASDNGELGTVVKNHRCGLVVPDNSVSVLRSAIEALLDASLLREFQRNALNAGRRYYNWSKMEEKLYNVYVSLV